MTRLIPFVQQHILRYAALILCLCLLAGCSFSGITKDSSTIGPVDGNGKLRVIFIDVGQGGSQLIITPSGKAMLIDAGNNDKEQVMLDTLKEYGISRLDIVIGTHPDADHIGGLDKVIDQLSIGRIYMPKISSNTKTFESVLRSIKRKGLKVSSAKGDLTLNLDSGVKVHMLAPLTKYEDNNNMSAVVKVSYGEHSFLLTGDSEADSEQDMLASGADLRSNVLLVGHHGSKSSTSVAFLKKVNPQYAVIQSGRGNKYGHPTQTILERLQKKGVKVYRNDTQGTVEFLTDGHHLQIRAER
ncbi:ComEC/Rec2 family competence protein [Paenibacillus sp. YPG26]|uniref:ComEC/Rec2 family competence protein n=1 Tax=Paenibacillus sp. YPG26 TaxID=2878915 RepID=UPI00203AD468|nr:ComEC/Rec2 family competence protein [Paenibacillus sp. YPG26]USB34547.1 MBL fold metallo-hydrolase [Paenibacillus sp. YPG26]